MRRSPWADVIPGQELVDVRLFVSASNGCQYVGQIAVGLNLVHFAGFDQRRDDGPVLCACIMTCEERVFAVQSDGANGALDGIVVELDATVGKEKAQPIPVFGDVFQGLPGR